MVMQANWKGEEEDLLMVSMWEEQAGDEFAKWDTTEISLCFMVD